MESTTPKPSEDSVQRKKLQGRIKLMNRKLRFKVNKSYMTRDLYYNDGCAGLEHKIKHLVKERNELKKKEWKLRRQKQDLKTKLLNMKMAYHALEHTGKDKNIELLSCCDLCCKSSSEESFEEDDTEEDSSEEY